MSSPSISRKAFIRLVSLAGIGAGVALLERITQPIGAWQFTKWVSQGKYQEYLGPKTTVGIGACPSYQADLLGPLRELWLNTGMPDVAGKKVLIKPNLVDTVDQHPSITAPQVVASVADLLIELGASQVVVGDGPAFRRDALAIVHSTGLAILLAARNIPFVDMNYDDPQPVKVKKGWFQGVEQIWLPRHAIEADLIVSVPKMKTHHHSGVSLSLKNLLGLFPGTRYGWPKNFMHFNGISSSILGLYECLPPVISIVDGIIGMEGDGPLFGTPVPHGIFIMGSDPVSVDITGARVMGFDLKEIEHLNMAAWAGIGQAARVKIVGLPVEQVTKKYQRPPIIK